jgi:U3 small nucleolar ribonucleoprotein protein IMP4
MSIRREIRLRKDFLYKKQQDAQQAIITEKKRKLKSALDEGKSIPTEIAAEARKLNHDMELDLYAPGEEKSIIDDEYATVGFREPKICVTTSRDPSSRLKQFSKYVILYPHTQNWVRRLR